jgi:hypothetical protein
MPCIACGQDRPHHARGRCHTCYQRIFRPRCRDCGRAALVPGTAFCRFCTKRAKRWYQDREALPLQSVCPGAAGIACGRAVALPGPPFAGYCVRCAPLLGQEAA